MSRVFRRNVLRPVVATFYTASCGTIPLKILMTVYDRTAFTRFGESAGKEFILDLEVAKHALIMKLNAFDVHVCADPISQFTSPRPIPEAAKRDNLCLHRKFCESLIVFK